MIPCGINFQVSDWVSLIDKKNSCHFQLLQVQGRCFNVKSQHSNHWQLDQSWENVTHIHFCGERICHRRNRNRRLQWTFLFLINNFLVQEKKNKSQKRTGRTTLHLLYKRTFSKRLCTLFTTMSNSIIITLVFTTSILLHFMLTFQISLIKEVGVCFRQVKKYAAPLQYWNHYTKHSSYIYHINYHLVTIHLKRSNV